MRSRKHTKRSIVSVCVNTAQLAHIFVIQLALKWHPDKNQDNPDAEEIVSHIFDSDNVGKWYACYYARLSVLASFPGHDNTLPLPPSVKIIILWGCGNGLGTTPPRKNYNFRGGVIVTWK